MTVAKIKKVACQLFTKTVQCIKYSRNVSYPKHFLPYFGSFSHTVYEHDNHAWIRTKIISLRLSLPNWKQILYQLGCSNRPMKQRCIIFHNGKCVHTKQQCLILWMSTLVIAFEKQRAPLHHKMSSVHCKNANMNMNRLIHVLPQLSIEIQLRLWLDHSFSWAILESLKSFWSLSCWKTHF